MKPANVKWRDWDWDGDPYTPGRLSTPGRLIFYVGDLWGEPASIHAADTATDVFAAALLNPAQTFILWTAHPERAGKFIEYDLFAPNVQRRAAQVMETLAGVAERREYPVRPINPQTGRQYTAGECAAWAATYGDPWAYACAGLSVPQGMPLLPNVWLGVRLSGRMQAAHVAHIMALGNVPAAVRFLYLPGGCECAFERFVWGERYEPIAVPSPAQGWKTFESDEPETFETRAMPLRRLDWILCGGISTAATEYHIAQAIETGTPVWVEAAEHLPLDCSVQLWPAQAEREPRLTPDLAAEQRRQLQRRKADGTI